MDGQTDVQIEIGELTLQHLMRQPGEEQQGKQGSGEAAEKQEPERGLGLPNGRFRDGRIVRQDVGKYSRNQQRRSDFGGWRPVRRAATPARHYTVFSGRHLWHQRRRRSAKSARAWF